MLLSIAVSSPFVESAKDENANLFIVIALAFLLAATAGGFAFTMQKRGKRE